MNTLVDAKTCFELVRKLKVFYGSQYNRHWSGCSDSEIAEGFLEILEGITLDQFWHGYSVLKGKGFVPTMPEFRNWCLDDGWFSPEIAWISVLRFVNRETLKITVQAWDAYKATSKVIENEGQKSGSFAFREAYSKIVENCRSKGISQEYIDQKEALKMQKSGESYSGERRGHLTKEQHAVNRQNIERIKNLIGVAIK